MGTRLLLLNCASGHPCRKSSYTSSIKPAEGTPRAEFSLAQRTAPKKPAALLQRQPVKRRGNPFTRDYACQELHIPYMKKIKGLFYFRVNGIKVVIYIVADPVLNQGLRSQSNTAGADRLVLQRHILA